MRTARGLTQAALSLEQAEERDREGAVAEAERCYHEAAELAESSNEHRILSVALRRLAVIAHHRNDSAGGRELCRRSLAVALDAGERLLAAEATNVGAMIDFEGG